LTPAAAFGSREEVGTRPTTVWRWSTSAAGRCPRASLP